MTSSSVTAPLSSLTGVIERITFHSPESGYTVARLNTGNVKQLTTIVGSFANIQAGQTLQLRLCIATEQFWSLRDFLILTVPLLIIGH